MDKDKTGLDPGVVVKAAKVETMVLDPDELKQINKHTLEPLTPDDVYTFKVAMCDNQTDRTYERFTQKCLKGMQKLFVGKTVLTDHRRSAANQVARIYGTELVTSDSEVTDGGEVYTQLVAKVYMINSEENKSLIRDIKGGIKKEASVNLQIGKAVCSVCGADNAKNYCLHWPGQSYENKLCTFTLDDPKDAYELSLVAVPAQPRAGVTKNYGGTEPAHDPAPDAPAAVTETAVRMKILDSFLYLNGEKGETYE